MQRFFLIELTGLLLLAGCREKVDTSVLTEFFVPEKELKTLMSGGLLVLPIVPVKGEGILGADYGRFVKKLQRKRKGQVIRIFGDKMKKIDGAQAALFRKYVIIVQDTRKIPDTLVFQLRGRRRFTLTLTPLILNHQVSKSPDGRGYQRRISIQVEGWSHLKKKRIFNVKSVSIHKADTEKELISGEVLLAKGLKDLAGQIFYDIPVSSLSPSGRPDF